MSAFSQRKVRTGLSSKCHGMKWNCNAWIAKKLHYFFEFTYYGKFLHSFILHSRKSRELCLHEGVDIWTSLLSLLYAHDKICARNLRQIQIQRGGKIFNMVFMEKFVALDSVHANHFWTCQALARNKWKVIWYWFSNVPITKAQVLKRKSFPFGHLCLCEVTERRAAWEPRLLLPRSSW